MDQDIGRNGDARKLTFVFDNNAALKGTGPPVLVLILLAEFTIRLRSPSLLDEWQFPSVD